MVGVARNQTCRNCRRKKKGCDFQKPACGQCARLGIRCGYDEKEWTFVNQKPPSRAMMGSFRFTVKHKNRGSPTRSSSPSSEESSLGRTAFETGSIEQFWSKYLPKDDSEKVSIGGVYAAFWCPVLQKLSTTDHTLKLALAACAVTILARVYADDNLLHQGTRLHTKAIFQVNRALSHSKLAEDDAVLGSCKLLALFESLRGREEEEKDRRGYNWHKHIEGICRIIQVRGPEKHTSDHGHTLFADSRIMTVIAGLTLRKPTKFFTSEEWNTVPWENAPRSLRDELLDVLNLLPELLQQQDRLSLRHEHFNTDNDRSDIIQTGQQLIQRCIVIGKAFRDWEERALAKSRARSIPTRLKMAESITLLDVCKDHGYGFFNLVMQYWVGCMILSTSARLISSMISSFTENETGTCPPSSLERPEIPDWMNPCTFASIIVACVPHYYRPEAGLWGPQSAAFPIGAVRIYFDGIGATDSVEMRQLHQVLEKAATGTITTDFLDSLEHAYDRAKEDSYNSD